MELEEGVEEEVDMEVEEELDVEAEEEEVEEVGVGVVVVEEEVGVKAEEEDGRKVVEVEEKDEEEWSTNGSNGSKEDTSSDGIQSKDKYEEENFERQVLPPSSSSESLSSLESSELDRMPILPASGCGTIESSITWRTNILSLTQLD